jgi:hypothetical protein
LQRKSFNVVITKDPKTDTNRKLQDQKSKRHSKIDLKPRTINTKSMPDDFIKVPIKHFPNNNRIYEVLWFGRVDRQSDEVVIEVLLRAEDAPIDAAPTSVFVGTNIMPFIPIGSRWQKKVPISSKPNSDLLPKDQKRSHHQTFEIEIDTSLSDFIPVNHQSPNPNPGKSKPNSTLPYWLYNFGKKGYPLVAKTLLAKFSAVYKNQTITVLIPTPVLIQFYWGSSNELARKVFEGALNGNPVDFSPFFDVEQSSVSPNNKEVKLALRQILLSGDAIAVARLWRDPQALESFRIPYRSLGLNILNPNASQLYKLEAKFPFEATSNLRVFGNYWMAGKTMLVTQILKCYHPLPFERVIITGRNEHVKNAPAEDQAGLDLPDYPLIRPSKPREKQKPPELDTIEPVQDNRIGHTIEQVMDCFDAVELEQEWTERIRPTDPHPLVFIPSPTGLRGSGTPDPSGVLPPTRVGKPPQSLGDTNKPADPNAVQGNKSPHANRGDYDFFIETMQALLKTTVKEQASGLENPLTSVTFRHGSRFEMNTFQTQSGQIDVPLCLFPEIEHIPQSKNYFKWLMPFGNGTQRSCIILEVMWNDRAFYVFELTRNAYESKKRYKRLFLYHPSRSGPLTSSELDSILEETAFMHPYKIWFDKGSSFPAHKVYTRSYLPHNTHQVHVAATSILKKIFLRALGRGKKDLKFIVPKPKKTKLKKPILPQP